MEREERIGINGGDGERAGNVPPLIPIRSSFHGERGTYRNQRWYVPPSHGERGTYRNQRWVTDDDCSRAIT